MSEKCVRVEAMGSDGKEKKMMHTLVRLLELGISHH